MKHSLLLFAIVFCLNGFSQKKCEYATNVNDSLGSYKSTPDFIVHERTLGNAQSTLFFSLIDADGLPSLKVQLIQKDNGFIAAKCFDKNSRVIVQLTNGKIVTLLPVGTEVCSEGMQNGEKDRSNRVLTGYFLFMKETIEVLKSAPISIMRIKYTSDTADYVIKSELVSEVDKKTYHPDSYFVDYLHCIN